MAYMRTGRILNVDLTRGDVTIEPTEPYIERFLRGHGINLKMLSNRLDVRRLACLSFLIYVSNFLILQAKPSKLSADAYILLMGISNIAGNGNYKYRFISTKL